MSPAAPNLELTARVCAAQNGDTGATETLLEQFRPLLRARMHRLWTVTREGLTTLEWGDIEAQITLLFLSRLQAFKPEAGVFFPHYIERMLELDARSWVRQQRRGQAIAFSQLWTDDRSDDDSSEPQEWLLEAAPDETLAFERSWSLQQALDDLPPNQREVVWNCCVLGKTESMVAGELGISRSAVRNRLESALGKLRAFFDSEENGTRTGRARPHSQTHSEAQLAPQEFWISLLMAKDEKRPDLVGVGAGRPVFLQGTYSFEATGLCRPDLLSPKLSFTVPKGHVAGVRYLRVGLICEKMAVLSTVVNGMTHRLVPIAANSTEHVPFAIVEPLIAGSQIEIHLACEAGGIAIVDVGILQMPA